MGLQGVRRKQEDPAGVKQDYQARKTRRHSSGSLASRRHLEAQLMMGSLLPLSNGEPREALYTEVRGSHLSSPPGLTGLSHSRPSECLPAGLRGICQDC